jgi:hypothetical protein
VPSKGDKASHHYTHGGYGGRRQNSVMVLPLLKQYSTNSEKLQQHVKTETSDGNEEPLRETLFKDPRTTISNEISGYPIGPAVAKMYEYKPEFHNPSPVASNNPRESYENRRFKASAILQAVVEDNHCYDES